LAKAEPKDFVDTMATTTFNVEISPSGLDQWISSVVSGGESIVNAASPNEGREYVITPSGSMLAGWYDVRTQAVDSRGQTGDWMSITGSTGFELKNGAPSVIQDPIPSVLCDTITNVSMVGHIVDPETSLENLIVTSDDASFIAWHPSTQEIEVNFEWSELNGCPLGSQGIEISIDDGGDYSATGELPYGTLLFSVTENGQPRWNNLPSRSVLEGLDDSSNMGILALSQYLSDTDDSGNPTSIDALTIELISNSNEEAIAAQLIGNVIEFQTVNADANGQAILTLRASDGVKTTDATLTITIQPVNDAPRLIPFDDLENIELKRNSQRVIALSDLIVDVDDPAAEAFVSVTSSEAGAARYSFLDGSLTLQFEETGMQTVTISLSDKYDSQIYVMNVNVYDAIPFLLSTSDNGSGYMFVSLADTYIGQTPTVTMLLTDEAPIFTSITVTWNVCSGLTGTCDGILEYELAVSESNSGWSKELAMPSIFAEGLSREDGSRYLDYYALSIVASDGTDDYKTMTDVKWDITESMPAVEDMEDEMFTDYLEDLTAKKTDLEAQIESATAGDDTSALETKLTAVEDDLATACDDPRATCVDDTELSSGTISLSEGMSTTMISLIAGAVILGLLLTLMITRRGRGKTEPDAWNGAAWDPNMVPAQDSVANSMYGGAQTLFQQPVEIQAAAPQLAGPPLPAGGLPAGWTDEQWSYYGQQYLDGTL